jgi:3-deoxy-manno-octulosonate cytidylyltransferase (CMP-KDO synthetase)
MVRVLGVIPARFASTRFPGKPLAPLGDGTLLSQVWRRVGAARRIDRVLVATDDTRIAEAARGFGAEVELSSPDHPSGTDRVAEVAARAGQGYDLVLNVQGDEPLVTPTSLDRLVDALDGAPDLGMATLAEPLESVGDLFDPNVVKVVTARDGRALYFSRAPIPFHRGAGALRTDFRDALAGRPGGLRGYRKHQGLYLYRAEVLRALAVLPPSPLELDEGLEQLRALEAGIAIGVVDSDFRSVGVDTPADLERAARALG